jgi:hypothetical protein
MKALPAVFGALLVVGCASSPGSEEPVVSVMRMSRLTFDGESLGDFRPVREAVLEGGECSATPLPQEGAQRLTVHFPSRASADTNVSLWVAPAGSLLRYSELRGVPRSGGSIEEVQALFRATESTHIQMDFATGEAMAVNSVPGEAGQAVQGSVAGFQASDVFGDLSERAERVRAICAEAP